MILIAQACVLVVIMARVKHLTCWSAVDTATPGESKPGCTHLGLMMHQPIGVHRGRGQVH